MNRPNKFIINSQFPTQKNEDRVSGIVLIPGSISVPAGATGTATLSLTSGSIGSLTRGQIVSSKNPTNRYATQAITFNRTGTVSGSPAPYQIVAFIWRSAPQTVSFQVLLKNPYAATLTGEAGNENITFYANQFVAPYR